MIYLNQNTKGPIHVFVLGTGRSGSTTIADLLNSITGCRVIHEAEPLLLTESKEYLYGNKNDSKIRELLLRTRSPEALGGRLLSGESNQRLSFILPVLAEVFPDAKYLWLIRDGRKAVASFYRRQWYHTRESELRPKYLEDWVINRIRGDRVGDLSDHEWMKLDAFGRCCWYWAFTNKLIEKETSRLNLNVRLCKLETLEHELPDILSFLGLTDVRVPKVQKSNPAMGLKPLPWMHWSRAWKDKFIKYCGEAMDQYYMGWREEFSVSWPTICGGFFDRSIRYLREISRPTRRKLKLIRK